MTQSVLALAALLVVGPVGSAGGWTVVATFDSLDALYAATHGRDVIWRGEALPVALLHARDAIWLPAWSVLEPDAAYALHLDTATRASRAREVQQGGWGGPSLDGKGIGIAIVDTGIDCTHADLAVRCAPGRNLRYAGGMYLPMEDTDLTHGHGTHVAGTAAGTGALSAGTHRGAAPGATLYGYGGGTGLSVAGALQAWDHILAHPGAPRILVVSNAFGAQGEPTTAESVALRALVAAGITPVVAAGNDGDAGTDAVNRLCKVTDSTGAPLPGLVCVANYADGEVGSVEGGIALTSSRGSWIDITTPGTHITAPRARSGAVVSSPVFASHHATTPPGYVTLTGTSMATGHAAGVVALLQHARLAAGVPPWSPAEVENATRATAHAFANHAPFPNRHAGHGLIDASAAARAAMGLPHAPGEGRGFATNRADGFLIPDAGVNADAPAFIVNDLAHLQGAPLRAPYARSIPPGVTSLRPLAFFQDAGGTPFARHDSQASVCIEVSFLASARRTDQCLARDAYGVSFEGASLSYDAARDGEVLVHFVLDARGDGVWDEVVDVAFEARYRPVAARPSPWGS